MIEEFREVPGYNGMYQISNLGTFKSFKTGKWKIIKGSFYKSGRRSFHLYDGLKDKVLNAAVVIMMAFKDFKTCGHNLVVDHIDNDCTNDRLDNLQIISNRENLSKDRLGASKFTGVSWDNQQKKWKTRISIKKINMHLGYFVNENEAGNMYKLALENVQKYNGNAKQFRNYLKSIM